MNWSVRASVAPRGRSTLAMSTPLGGVAVVHLHQANEAAREQARADDQDDGERRFDDEQRRREAGGRARRGIRCRTIGRRCEARRRDRRARRAPRARAGRAWSRAAWSAHRTAGPSHRDAHRPGAEAWRARSPAATRTSHHASTRPSAPPAIEKTALSVNSCRTIRPRLPPDRGPDRQLALPRDAARQQQIRDVGARDHQHQRDRHGQHGQRRPRRCRHVVDHRARVDDDRRRPCRRRARSADVWAPPARRPCLRPPPARASRPASVAPAP